MYIFQLFTILLGISIATAAQADQFSINDAIKQAAVSNPGVGEATANRRATESEMRQSQGTLLPQVRLEASAGPESLRRYITPAPVGNVMGTGIDPVRGGVTGAVSGGRK